MRSALEATVGNCPRRTPLRRGAALICVFALIGFVLQFAAVDASHGAHLGLEFDSQNAEHHLGSGANHHGPGRGHHDHCSHATCSISVAMLDYVATRIERSTEIWDVANNKIYKGRMMLGEAAMRVEGCVAIFCDGQNWSRVEE
jgi:hypothetical protein